MPHVTHRFRTGIARALRLGAGLSMSLLLASCSKDSTPTTPIVSTPGPPGPMIVLAGNPRVSCDVQAFTNASASVDTMSGYFEVMLNDSLVHRTFVGPVTLNGVPMRYEVDSFDRPLRYSLRPVDLGPGYTPADTLHFAISDTAGISPPFQVTVVPSTLQLLPDLSTLSQKQDLVVHWTGAAEQVKLSLTDQSSVRVSANLQFENESGVSELLIRAQDLKVLAPGPLTVGSLVTNSETSVTVLGKRVSATMSVVDGRGWHLVP